MNPEMLVHQASAGMPAPVWFVQFFKVLGFTLHMVPMNLWFAGLAVALGLHLGNHEYGRKLASRLMRQMPILVAFGINLGIVPLLFVQLAYYKVFYPATILMAWFWIGIIVLLIPAYYGIYIYAWGLKKNAGKENGFPAWKRMVGWVSMILFFLIGFLFSNGISLMDHVARWPDLWKHNQLAGAALGTALNLGDASMWPRYFLMFGLALGTTAVWILADAAWLASDAVEAYRQWTLKFARKVYTVGMIWTAVAGTWYVFGTWPSELRAAMFQFPTIFLTLATGMAMGLPWLLLMKTDGNNPLYLIAIAASQFGVLAINAISRQIVQNINLKPYLDVLAQPTDVQWSPLLMFLITFVLGLAIIAWMLAQVFAASHSKK